jgi:hypothetical protein
MPVEPICEQEEILKSGELGTIFIMLVSNFPSGARGILTELTACSPEAGIASTYWGCNGCAGSSTIAKLISACRGNAGGKRVLNDASLLCDACVERSARAFEERPDPGERVILVFAAPRCIISSNKLPVV